MKESKKAIVNEEEMKIRANLNNLEPGDSVNEQRALEKANLMLTSEEIKQQNNNL